MTFTARSSALLLDLGGRVSFIPDAHDPTALPPPIPAGAVVPLALDRDHLILTIETATRTELIARTSEGRRMRLTPQTPAEPGGFYEPGRGMSIWVVREIIRA